MQKLIDRMIESAYDEIEDVQKYMNMSNEAREAGWNECAGIIRDIAHEECTHAKHIIGMLRMHNGVPEELMEKYENCKRKHGDA